MVDRASLRRTRSVLLARRLQQLKAIAGEVLVNGLLGLGSMVVLALGTGGFSLVAAGRIWGSFWLHFAKADAAERAPFHAAALALWVFLSVCAWLFRRQPKGA